MMITFLEAEKLLRGVACPECLHAELGARFHLQDESECLCSARCAHCGATFELEFTRFEKLNVLQRRVAATLEHMPCQVCGQMDYGLVLQCDQPSQNCYLEADCRICGEVYQVEDHAKLIHLVRSVGLNES